MHCTTLTARDEGDEVVLLAMHSTTLTARDEGDEVVLLAMRSTTLTARDEGESLDNAFNVCAEKGDWRRPLSYTFKREETNLQGVIAL